MKRMNREVVKKFRAVLSERSRHSSDWKLELGIVLWDLNLAYRERMGTNPSLIIRGRPHVTAVSVLAGGDGHAWTMEELDVSTEQI